MIVFRVSIPEGWNKGENPPTKNSQTLKLVKE